MSLTNRDAQAPSEIEHLSKDGRCTVISDGADSKRWWDHVVVANSSSFWSFRLVTCW